MTTTQGLVPVHDDVDEAAVSLVGGTEQQVLPAHKANLDRKVSVEVVLYPSLQLTQHQRCLVSAPRQQSHPH